MNEPALAVRLLRLFCRDEALVGDILEEYQHRRSRAWLWRQVGVCVLFGLPYGTTGRRRATQKMPLPAGGLGLVAIVALVTIVAPGAWWLVVFGVLGGIALAFAFVRVTRRKVERDAKAPRHTLLRVLAAVAASTATTHAAQTFKPAVPIDPVDGIVEAFKTHEVVMLPGGHGSKPAHDLLIRILRDPRIQGIATDIVVEFGTSRYQDMIDRYMRGDEIPFSALKHAWQDTVIRGVTNDGPYVEDFYRSVRAINAGLRAEKRFRVLGGDPPIDWQHVVTKADHRKWEVRRDTFPADLIRREVVERGRRALVVYGQQHFPRHEIMANYDMSNWQAQTMTSLLEKDGVRVFVILLEGGAGTPESWPPRSLVLIRGTALGAADFADVNGQEKRYAVRGIDDFVEIPKERYRPMRMEDQVDAILWRLNDGPTPILLSKETCADPAYLPMREKRITLGGAPAGEVEAVRRACGLP